MGEPSLRNRTELDKVKPKDSYDYVLVYEQYQEEGNVDTAITKKAEELQKKRGEFKNTLRDAGLEIESHNTPDTTRHLDVKSEIWKKIKKTCCRKMPKEPKITRHFVLLRAPWEVLAKYAEEMHVKVPFKTVSDEGSNQSKIIKFLKRINPLEIQDDNKGYFMANFRQDSFDKFINHDNKDNFFDKVCRIYIVQQICYNSHFGEGSQDVGLRKMIYDGAYVAGYPLHDKSIDPDEPGKEPTNPSDRQQLKRDWARFGRIFKFQPYGAIKNYFGSGIALYFAWVGYYTAMLAPLAVLGLLVFLYGIYSADSHIPVTDVCDDNNKGKWYMCPMCDVKCNYWDLASTSTCLYAYATHLFDNEGTVFLAVFASIWGTLFLEFWKRRQGIISHEWRTDSFEEEEEPLRPEFSETNKIKRYSRYGGVVSIIVFMIAMVIGAVVGVIIYRAVVFASLSEQSDIITQTRARIITSVTAALLNLLAINVMKLFYNKLAVWLTDWENPRTRSAYEYSFTWKMYSFQFVNTYASVFYIAFFKSGHIIGTPSKYKRVAGSYRLDGCSEQGCFLELCVQLFILMVGQQIVGIILEVAIPYWIRARNSRRADYDFDLSPLGDHFLFWEYLQAVLQYGFATMFVAAFPLGPLFALLTSLIRIRVDAINFVFHFRRPDITHAKDIGAWYHILKWVTKISILVNAFVLAFTSEFIPKLLYRLKFAPDHDSPGGGTLTGYINNSLSSIDTKDIFRKEPGREPENPYANLPHNSSVCRYPGYHEDLWPYNFSKQYWEVTAARLAFVFVFQFTVFFISNSIKKIVPDVPKGIALKRKQEKELIKSVFGKKRRNNWTQTDGSPKGFFEFSLNTVIPTVINGMKTPTKSIAAPGKPKAKRKLVLKSPNPKTPIHSGETTGKKRKSNSPKRFKTKREKNDKLTASK